MLTSQHVVMMTKKESTPTTENIVGQWVLTYEEGYEIEPEYPEEKTENGVMT